MTPPPIRDQLGGGVSVLERHRVPVVCVVIGLAFFLFFFRLGDRSFRNPDEGRYADIAREMVLRGDWVEPRLYGVDYLRKPPLFYWLVAGSFKLLGFSEWAARAVPALFGFFGVLATYFFARRFFGDRSAFFSALLLASNLWYLGVSRYLLMDAVFTFFVVGSLYLFFTGAKKIGSKSAGAFFLLSYASMALAFLTKGLAGAVIPSAAIFFYLLLTKQFRTVLPRMQIFWGVALFGAIALPWFISVSLREEEFLSFFFLHEHFKRFLSTDFEHQEGWYFYFLVLPVIFMPWVLFKGPMKESFRALRRGPGDHSRFFLLVCALSVVFFYSLSRSKLPTYILPAVVFFSVLIADGCSRWKHARAGSVFYGIVAIFSAASIGVGVAMEKANPNYTTKSFAEALKARLNGSDERIFIYDHPGAFYDFEFYLGHPVKLVGLGGELKLAKPDERVEEASITLEKFKEILNSPESIYCLMRQSDYLGWEPGVRKRVRILKEDKRKVLIANLAALSRHGGAL